MHKLQCLSLAKNFLNGCFKGTLSHLAQKSYWRDTFMDQLTISYKHFLVDKTQADTNKFLVAEDYIEEVVKDQVFAVAKHKENIKQVMKHRTIQREATRVIESTSRRIVHFIFNPMQSTPITPIARKFSQLMDGKLEEFEREEHDKFE